MGEPELSYTADENEDTVTSENSFIIKHIPTVWSSHSLLGIYSREMETYVHTKPSTKRAIVAIFPKLETI